MSTKCKYNNGKQNFSSDAQFISTGVIESNQQVVNTTDETVLISETIYADTLTDTKMHFRVTLAGEISSDGSDDITFTLRYDTTDILELATVSLANEDDDTFRLTFEGRVHTAGASGKIVAVGKFEVDQGTPLYFWNDTANTGTSVDLTADGSLNVTGKWDGAAADSDIIVTVGFIELFN